MTKLDDGKRKDLHEDFTKFFEKPTRDKLSKLLEKHRFEYTNIDYKEGWDVEPSKLSRHILALSNSEGGCIVFGVSEDDKKKLIPTGLDELKDEADFKNMVKGFIPEYLSSTLELANFSLSGSNSKVKGEFQVLFVGNIPSQIPFISKKDGKNINENTIYFRDGTQSLPANYEQLQSIIDRRLRTNITSNVDLKEDLKELKILYESMTKSFNMFTGLASLQNTLAGVFESVKNEKYPKEDFEDFVVDMISRKKEKVRSKIL
jgi:predicted HTH transcriptional regulator